MGKIVKEVMVAVLGISIGAAVFYGLVLAGVIK